MGFGFCVVKGHRPILIVQEHPDDLRPLRQTQQLGPACTRPVLHALPQTNDPVTILRAQRDQTFPVDGLPSHTQVPRRLVSNVDLPVVSAGGETLRRSPVSLWFSMKRHKETEDFLLRERGHMELCQNALVRPPLFVQRLRPVPAVHLLTRRARGWRSWGPDEHRLAKQFVNLWYSFISETF